MDKLTWKDVFDSRKIYPMNYEQCREWTKKSGYDYLAFNGWVYPANDDEMTRRVCLDSVL